ncbi:MAG: hypothetical protein AAGA70_03645 [Pseudomonadota bacterium]
MKRRSLRILIVVVLVGYPILSTGASFAIGGVKTHPSRELFPFFTWSLFSWVPEVRHHYVVEITRLNGQVFDPPIEMNEVPEFSDRTSLAYKAVQDLGRAGGSDAGERATFEARYLGGQDVDYRIVRQSYAPLERWHGAPPDATMVVGEYSVGSAE